MSKERYVVITNRPYQWSSGPSASFFDELEGPGGAQIEAEYWVEQSGARGTAGYISVAIGVVAELN